MTLRQQEALTPLYGISGHGVVLVRVFFQGYMRTRSDQLDMSETAKENGLLPFFLLKFAWFRFSRRDRQECARTRLRNVT